MRRISRLTDADDTTSGFTLIELMVVVLVIGVLLGIGVPILLGARQRSADTAAKARTEHGLKVQKVFYSDGSTYGTADDIAPIDQSVEFAPYNAGTGPAVLGKVYVHLQDASTVELVTRSSTGTCFWTRAVGATTMYAKADCSVSPDDLTFGSSW